MFQEPNNLQGLRDNIKMIQGLVALKNQEQRKSARDTVAAKSQFQSQRQLQKEKYGLEEQMKIREQAREAEQQKTKLMQAIKEKVAGQMAAGRTQFSPGYQYDFMGDQLPDFSQLKPVTKPTKPMKLGSADLETQMALNTMEADQRVPDNAIPENIQKILSFIPGFGQAANMGGKLLGQIGRKSKVEEMASQMNQPFIQQYRNQFNPGGGGGVQQLGQGGGVSEQGAVQDLVSEYYTTDDPARMAELEAILEQMGLFGE